MARRDHATEPSLAMTTGIRCTKGVPMTADDRTEEGSAVGDSQTVRDQISAYRHARREFEQAVLPLATSVDGRLFRFQASLYDLPYRAGGYVVLEGNDGGGGLGQILTVGLEVTDARATHTGGTMLLRSAGGDGIMLNGDFRPFHDAPMRPADPAEVRRWLATIRPPRATLEIGELLHAPGVPAWLDAGGFDRHTFLCGQSGSGKTYSLGLVLEQLLLETSLRMVILDPNSDYIRLAETHERAERAAAARYATAAKAISVRRAATEGGGQPIRLSFAELSRAERAAVLQIDPIADRDEYGVLTGLLEAQEEGRPLVASVDDLAVSGLPGSPELAQRAANLGVLDWTIWARGQSGSIVGELKHGEARCLVIDLGSLNTREEQRVVGGAVLSTLWERRGQREPILIVIDEAHNVCPAEPNDPLTELATEHVVRIATEGRKYGLYLLLSTQRPQQVVETAVSQCDNLVLLRMNSPADLAFIRTVFGFVPAGLLEPAATFRQGEALIAGKISSHAAHVRFGARVAAEGGADIPTSWAARSA